MAHFMDVLSKAANHYRFYFFLCVANQRKKTNENSLKPKDPNKQYLWYSIHVIMVYNRKLKMPAVEKGEDVNNCLFAL